MKLTPAQLDRACGALLGTAVGDALGAGYEFGSAPLGAHGPEMIGGGLGHFAPGEWTDDTTMMWCIADVAATESDLGSDEGLTAIARNFRGWYERGPADIGIQTSQVLRTVGSSPTGAEMTTAAMALHARTRHTAGNGSLMRTAPVALPYLESPERLVEAARRISGLTHQDPDARDACVLWSMAIRHAILHAEFDVRVGLPYLSPPQAVRWRGVIGDAESSDPKVFAPNGWVVTAFQAAWSSIFRTPVPDHAPCTHLQEALATVIEVGHDTDTTAAIAGGLLGARWGASAVPAGWRRVLHGYPGIRAGRLEEIATLAANRGPVVYGWPVTERIDYSIYPLTGACVQHPHDGKVWLGDAAALDDLPDEVTAVVSLCLLGPAQRPEGREHITYRLIDTVDPAANPHLAFVLADAAAAIAALRAEGHTVFLHCVAAQSRTPTVAIAYALTLGVGLEEARSAVLRSLPNARPNAAFLEALTRLAGPAGG